MWGVNWRAILLLGFSSALIGCATSKPSADKPAMRALGQAAEPEVGASDEAIGMEIRRRLAIADASMTASVIVEVNAGVVTLRGAAPRLQDAWRAEGTARAVPGAKEVRNEILVQE
jgi:osmotically-inducible protein OsmY